MLPALCDVNLPSSWTRSNSSLPYRRVGRRYHTKRSTSRSMNLCRVHHPRFIDEASHTSQVSRNNAKLLHSLRGPDCEPTKEILGIAASPISQCKPKMSSILPCSNGSLVVRCSMKYFLQRTNQPSKTCSMSQTMRWRRTHLDVLLSPDCILSEVSCSRVLRDSCECRARMLICD